MSDEKFTSEPRPVEPYSTSENPGRWAEVAIWEEERANAAENERDQLRARVAELRELLVESGDIAIALQNYVETMGWTRHKNNELEEVKKYREKVKQALAKTQEAADGKAE
jgi:quinol monooxygenase YgiN